MMKSAGSEKHRYYNRKASVVGLIFLLMLLMLTACAGADKAQEPQESEVPDQNTESTEEIDEMTSITMKINEEEVAVTWEDNESVKALAKLASDAPLVIDTSMYGGFEQVGPIGTVLPSSDVNITTNPGDIVLYTGSNIVVFYGNNSWDYTKLGHIENKSADELADLLGNNNVTITLTAE
jgi:hypothetical protein